MWPYRARNVLPASVLCSLVLATATTAASETPRDTSSVTKLERPPSPTNEYRWSVGARGFIAPGVGVAALGVGGDAAYSLLPNFAVGAAVLLFVADQGADPHYCVRCIRNGRAFHAFAEGRYWPEGWATPYARLGAGYAHVRGQRFEYDDGYSEDNLGLIGELGIEWHYRFASLRTFAFDQLMLSTELDDDPFIAFGAQLGARF